MAARTPRIVTALARGLGRGVLLLLAVVMLFFLLVTAPAVQGWLARQAARIASEQLGAEVRIGHLRIRPFGPLELDRVFIGDLHGDTLIAVNALRVKGLRILPRRHVVQASALELQGARFALAMAEGDRQSNLTNLLDQLAGAEDTTAGADWTIRCARFLVEDLHFSYHDDNYTPIPFGVDFDHVDVRDARLKGHHFLVAGDSISAHLEGLSLRERSGLRLDQLAGATVVRGNGINIAQLVLRTPGSDLHGALAFSTESWSDYKDFTSRVNMRIELDSSRLEFADVAFFAPGLEGIRFPISVQGRVRGTVDDMKGTGLSIHFGERSHFKGSADLSGLPDVANTFMLLDIDELRTDHRDLATLPVPPFTTGDRLALPAEVRELGNITFSGNFTGFTSAFTAYGRSTTALGALRTDVSYERDTLRNVFSLSGRMATGSFLLGPLLGVSELGDMAANIRINGTGRTLATMQADIEGNFPHFTYGAVRLTGITANGRLEPGRFNGSLAVNDEHLLLDFKGLADLSGRWPQVDFSANVQHADLGALGITRVKDYNTLSVYVRAAGRLSPDSLQGRVEVTDISYCDEAGEHFLGDLLLTSGRRDGENLLELTSTFADAEVQGLFLPTKLAGAIASVVYSVFPALSDEVEYAQAEQRFRFLVIAKETKPVLELFVPGLEVAPGSRFSGWLDTRSFDIGFTAELPGLFVGPIRAMDVSVIAEKNLDLLAFSVRSERQTWNDSVWFAGTSFVGKAYQDELEFGLGWDNSNSGTNGDLDIQGEVRGTNSFRFELLPSHLYFGRGNWMTMHNVPIAIDSGTVRIDSLVLVNDAQRISIDGTISHDTSAYLAFDLRDVSLENLNPFIDGPELKGTANANGRLHGLYDAPFVLSHLALDSVSVRDIPVGDLRFDARWAEGQRAIDLAGTLMRGPIKALDFNGNLQLSEGNPLDLDLVLDRFDLTFIDPYLPEGVSRIQGLVTGTIDVTGTLGDPQVNGELDLVDAGMRIDYLNTSYSFSHRVKVAPDMFALDFVTIRDEEGNTARVSGTLLHDGLRNWNYNFFGSMERFLVLNTTLRDNNLYYGRAYGTGDIELSGHAGSLEIVVNARTAPGTDIHFPVGASTEVSPIGFVHFAATDTLDGEAPLVDLSGVSLDLKVTVTPDAHFELIFDPTVGDILSGRGRGNIEMSVAQTGEFDMRGQVEVSEGDYLFTLRNVVNKRFQLESGGRITWYGDPFDALLDLRATYKLRAPLYEIMFEKNDAYRKRIPVEVVMKLRDKLLNPEIGFEVRLPTVDEGTRTQVNSVLSTEQELNRQVFALIVLNRFVQPPTYAPQGQPGGGNVAGTTTSELLSNQVSNWLSKLSSDFDLGVSYRPGDNITQDEVELAVSTQLFDERLLVSTQVGVQYGAQAAQNSNSFVGDFQVEYLLTNDGKLRLKAFSVSNDRNLNRADQALTTQGAGVAFRQEFDTWEEFWQKVGNVFRSDAKDR